MLFLCLGPYLLHVFSAYSCERKFLFADLLTWFYVIWDKSDIRLEILPFLKKQLYQVAEEFPVVVNCTDTPENTKNRHHWETSCY